MAIILAGGASGVLADVDANKNLQVTQGLDAIPAAGGFYTCTGSAVSIVAASLASLTNLMSMRVAAGSTRIIQFTRLRVCFNPATIAAAGAVPGVLGLQRFTAQTPTGGVARTPCRMDELVGTISDVTDVRDSNAALTGTAPTWGTIAGSSLIPVWQMTTSGLGGGAFEWIFEPRRPVKLVAGDGLGLRTQVACPAGQTWVYSWEAEWNEK